MRNNPAAQYLVGVFMTVTYIALTLVGAALLLGTIGIVGWLLLMVATAIWTNVPAIALWSVFGVTVFAFIFHETFMDLGRKTLEKRG